VLRRAVDDVGELGRRIPSAGVATAADRDTHRFGCPPVVVGWQRLGHNQARRRLAEGDVLDVDTEGVRRLHHQLGAILLIRVEDQTQFDDLVTR
jgi:hypothetical protein